MAKRGFGNKKAAPFSKRKAKNKNRKKSYPRNYKGLKKKKKS